MSVADIPRVEPVRNVEPKPSQPRQQAQPQVARNPEAEAAFEEVVASVKKKLPEASAQQRGIALLRMKQATRFKSEGKLADAVQTLRTFLEELEQEPALAQVQ